MDGFKTFVMIAYVSLGLFIAALAVPMIRRRVAPNRWYGFRVPRTLEDPKVWYEANAYAGKCLFWFGIALSLISLLLWFVPGLDPLIYSMSCLMICLVGSAVSVTMSLSYLNRIPR